jgi:hypothetical protein
MSLKTVLCTVAAILLVLWMMGLASGYDVWIYGAVLTVVVLVILVVKGRRPVL